METTSTRPTSPTHRPADEPDARQHGVAFVGAVGQQLDRAREARERRAARARSRRGGVRAA